MAPQNFIVRIYRLPANRAGRVAGLVEVVGTGERHRFSTAEELWGVISRKPARGRRRSNSPSGTGEGD
jgi:hypothetical protein